jgi:hypothetical protein
MTTAIKTTAIKTTATKSTATKPERGAAAVAERVAPATGVQTAKVSADEAGMRVDRFLRRVSPGCRSPISNA